ncbi:unnamed protein product [Prorocentrum cordatum]|uniref:Aspartate/homoserine dehydrogenase NAD-binding domain-containing protein n=1 Tax=Prorocentrum cordatum TaxID=2364126 RepID=A0ABN9RY59_9DINO|nr:unnamed protein product [Polarella glacialis]
MAAAAAALPAARRLRVGLIGHGTIGQYVAEKLLDGRTLPGATLSAVLVSRPRDPPPELSGEGAPLFTADAEAFLGAPWDLAVEAAGQAAVRGLAARCLGPLRRDFMVTSVGALCDDALHRELLGAAEQSGARLLIAAGALPGMDWMSSAALEEVEAVSITQIKRPEGWTDRHAGGGAGGPRRHLGGHHRLRGLGPRGGDAVPQERQHIRRAGAGDGGARRRQGPPGGRPGGVGPDPEDRAARRRGRSQHRGARPPRIREPAHVDGGPAVCREGDPEPVVARVHRGVSSQGASACPRPQTRRRRAS